MMDQHEERVEAAKTAINRVFGDTSVPQSTTRESLEDLIEDIKSMLETLE
jgi:hypothetical protein